MDAGGIRARRRVNATQAADRGYRDREEHESHDRKRERRIRGTVRVAGQHEEDQQDDDAAEEAHRPAPCRQPLDAPGRGAESLQVGVVERDRNDVADLRGDEHEGGRQDLAGGGQRQQRRRHAAEQREEGEQRRVRATPVGPRADKGGDDAGDQQRCRRGDAPQRSGVGAARRDVGREVQCEQHRGHDSGVGRTRDVVEHPRQQRPARIDGVEGDSLRHLETGGRVAHGRGRIPRPAPPGDGRWGWP